MENSDLKENKKKQSFKRLIIVLNNFSALLSFVLAALVIGAVLFYFVYPKYKGISREMVSSAEIRQDKIDALNSYNLKLNEYLKGYNRITEKDEEKLDRMIPEKKYNKEELFAYMESFLSDRGLMLDSVSLREGERNSRKKSRPVNVSGQEAAALPAEVEEVTVDLKIIGLDYTGLKKLLREFERNLRLMDVQSVNFDLASKEASLSVAMYYLPKNE